MNKDAMREAFESKFPVPIGLTYNPIMNRYIYLVAAGNLKQIPREYNIMWEVWQAALSQQQAGEDELVNVLEVVMKHAEIEYQILTDGEHGTLYTSASFKNAQKLIVAYRARKGE